jgi:hypothetical protein
MAERMMAKVISAAFGGGCFLAADRTQRAAAVLRWRRRAHLLCERGDLK